MVKRLAAALILFVVCLALDVVALLWQTVALAAGRSRGWRLVLSQDQLGNVLTGGDEDEWISSRAWRKRHTRPWCWIQPAIDWVAAALGDADHCRKAFQAEQVKAATRAGWRFSRKD